MMRRLIGGAAAAAAMVLVSGCLEGPVGPQGESGAPGVPGQDGSDGEGIIGIYSNDTYWHVFPLPSDTHSVHIANWPGLAPGQTFAFSAWASATNAQGQSGLVEFPFLVQSGGQAYQAFALFDPATGNVHFSYAGGWYVMCQVVIFSAPGH